MFQGETAITIDDKGRMAVPTAFRDQVARDHGNRLVITYNPFDGGSLWIFPYEAWEPLRDHVNRLPKVKTANRLMQFKVVGAATVVELDGNGRITLPKSMREAIDIERKAVLLGMGDKFELWSEKAHTAQVRAVLSDEDLTDDLLDLPL
ncbi:division/cell wall cluster transcriptional repressor MraZ [Lysobacter sp. GX 14042]|uniref:division/cell wall cluster transcriptional repressor MraZ n=1 Tax=Lysobacter sp. GX 14042 TaxID=2907155 RepID=UPI001F3DC3D6|nr:division/cell wall cluster transcriptional repressor MraZ [Lysobacter sp. GX 14042]MCE7031974.1 division/cell wall cluster transcriptional repressor MraZ [Lysobacter sp. GX 14042]